MASVGAKARSLCYLMALTLAPVISTSVHPQQPQAAISGSVTEAGTGTAVADAVVSIFSAGSRPVASRQLTDSQGRFVFVGLGEGSYRVYVTKSGYQPGGFGKTGLAPADITPIALQSGQWFSQATVRLVRWTSLAGSVADELGSAVAGAYVSAARVTGRGEYVLASTAVTDDRGRFSLSSLAAGRYVVVVQGSLSSDPSRSSRSDAYPRSPDAGADRAVYPLTFYGDVTELARAEVIQVDSDRSGVDIRLRPARGATLKGRLQSMVGDTESAPVRLIPKGLESFGPGFETAVVTSDRSGYFEFVNVPAASYVVDVPLALHRLHTGRTQADFFYGFSLLPAPSLRVSRQVSEWVGPADIQLATFALRPPDVWGRVEIEVTDGNPLPVQLVLNAASILSGSLELDTDGARQSAEPIQIMLQAATRDLAQGLVRTASAGKGEFTISRIPPGRWRVRVPPGWFVKSLIIRGREYRDDAFEIESGAQIRDVKLVLSNRTGSVSGTVASTSPTVVGVDVLAVPSSLNRVDSIGFFDTVTSVTRAATDGSFQFAALPPGDYHLVAVRSLDGDDLRNPEYLARISFASTKVAVVSGEAKQVKLSNPSASR